MLVCFDELESWGLCEAYSYQSFEPVLEDFGPVPDSSKCDLKFRYFPMALYAFLKDTQYGAPISPRDFKKYQARLINDWPIEKQKLGKLFKSRSESKARATPP
jgi:hypothetical protein